MTKGRKVKGISLIILLLLAFTVSIAVASATTYTDIVSYGRNLNGVAYLNVKTGNDGGIHQIS